MGRTSRRETNYQRAEKDVKQKRCMRGHLEKVGTGRRISPGQGRNGEEELVNLCEGVTGEAKLQSRERVPYLGRRSDLGNPGSGGAEFSPATREGEPE